MIPNIIFKQLKKPFFGKFMVKWRNPLNEEEQKKWNKEFVDSTSNSKISVWIQAAQNAKATVVLGHPMGKEAKGYFLKRGYTELLIDNGFNVVIFDLNGFGESTNGNFNYYDDILNVTQFAKRQFPLLPLAYHGISLSSHYGLLSFNNNSPVDFAIIESAATSMREFWFRFPFAMKAVKIFEFFAPQYAKKIHFIKQVKNIKEIKKILFIYPEKDEWTPVEMGMRFVNNCAIPAELYTTKHGKHAEITKSESKKEYFDKVISFYNQQLKST